MSEPATEKTFPNPFAIEAPEGAEGWQELYPYYYTFSRGAPRLRGGQVLVLRRDAQPRADLPVRRDHDRELVGRRATSSRRACGRSRRRSASTTASSTATSTSARTRSPTRTEIAQRVPGLPAARRVTTSRTGTRSTPRWIAKADGLHRAAAGDRVRRRCPSSRTERVVTEHPRRLRDLPPASELRRAAREHVRDGLVPLRDAQPRLRRLPRRSASSARRLPRHHRPDDRPHGRRHRHPALPARRRGAQARAAGASSSASPTPCSRTTTPTSSLAAMARRPRRRRVAGRARGGQGPVVLVLDRRRLHAHRPGLDRRPAAAVRARCAATSTSSRRARTSTGRSRQILAERERITAEYRELLAADDDRAAFDGLVELARQVYPVRREPQLLRRALAPLALLEQGPRARARLRRRTASSATARTSSSCTATRSTRRCTTCSSAGRRGAGAAARRYWPPEIVAQRRAILDALRDRRRRPRWARRPTTITEPLTVMLWGITNDIGRQWLGGRRTDAGGAARRRGLAGHGRGPARVVMTAGRAARRRDGRHPRLPRSPPRAGRPCSPVAAAVSDIGGIMAHTAIVSPRVRPAGRRRHRLRDPADHRPASSSRSTATRRRHAPRRGGSMTSPHRIGLIVPSSNTTMETELPELFRRYGDETASRSRGTPRGRGCPRSPPRSSTAW